MVSMNKKVDVIIGNTYTPRLQGSAMVSDALEMMEEYEVSVIGVECESEFVGLFSRKDLESKVLQWHLHPNETSLYEVIVLSPPYVTPDLTIREAHNVMLAYQWDYLPVLSNSGKRLLGIVHMKHLREHIDASHDNFNESHSIIISTQPQEKMMRDYAATEKIPY